MLKLCCITGETILNSIEILVKLLWTSAQIMVKLWGKVLWNYGEIEMNFWSTYIDIIVTFLGNSHNIIIIMMNSGASHVILMSTLLFNHVMMTCHLKLCIWKGWWMHFWCVFWNHSLISHRHIPQSTFTSCIRTSCMFAIFANNIFGKPTSYMFVCRIISCVTNHTVNMACSIVFQAIQNYLVAPSEGAWSQLRKLCMSGVVTTESESETNFLRHSSNNTTSSTNGVNNRCIYMCSHICCTYAKHAGSVL